MKHRGSTTASTAKKVPTHTRWNPQARSVKRVSEPRPKVSGRYHAGRVQRLCAKTSALEPALSSMNRQFTRHRRNAVRPSVDSAQGATSRCSATSLRVSLDRAVSSLFGGQRAQVALSLALAKRPRVLLLDEPLAALDPVAGRELLASFADVPVDGDVTPVLTASRVRLPAPTSKRCSVRSGSSRQFSRLLTEESTTCLSTDPIALRVVRSMSFGPQVAR